MTFHLLERFNSDIRRGSEKAEAVANIQKEENPQVRTLNLASYFASRWLLVASVLILFGTADSRAALVNRHPLAGAMPAVVRALAPAGTVSNTNRLRLAIGLPLRDQAGLDALFQQLYDPRGNLFHHFILPADFTARFAPSEQDYQAVVNFAQTNGLVVTHRYANRMVLDVEGSVSNVDQALRITLRTFQHPTEARTFFAPDAVPSVPANVPIRDIWGLSDFSRPQALVRPVSRAKILALNFNGSGPAGDYQGNDFRHAYVPGTSLVGTGQTAAVVEFDGYYSQDILDYENQINGTNVPLENVLLDGVSGFPGFSGFNNAVLEVSLDIEMLVSMAPGLAKIMVYEGLTPYDVLAQIASDDKAKQISCSWTFGYGPTFDWTGTQGTLDSQLEEMAVQGQSFFQAAGDSDAYAGGQALNPDTGPTPVDSIYVTCVGGTSLTMDGSGVAWESETVWNPGLNLGSGGGISTNYAIPAWQTNVSMVANGGSSIYRNIPDVSLTADAVFVEYGSGGKTNTSGTSCAAPLWAGLCALVNQQEAMSGTGSVGFLNPALYAIGTGAAYNACFHDTVTGNNIGTNTPGQFYATNGYDLCSGWGTPQGTNLINFLAPPTQPYFLVQPLGVAVTNGGSFQLSAVAAGPAPLAYNWTFNGAPLSVTNAAGGSADVLTVSNCSAENAGDYSAVVVSGNGVITSLVATVTVFQPAGLTAPLTGQTVECGGAATLAVTATGSPPPGLQWGEDGVAIPGATNAALTLTDLHSPNHTVTLTVTNLYGGVTNTVTITVADTTPPVITLNGANPLFLELGSAFTDPGATATDACAGAESVIVSGTVNTSVTGTNQLVYQSSDDSGNTSEVTRLVIVQDTTPPAILWSFTNLVVAAGADCTALMPDATGTNFIVATDLSGPPVITQAPPMNAVLDLGTNEVILTATDLAGNQSFSTNIIIVQDETPPLITTQPQSVTNAPGTTVNFSLTVAACTPVTYQWFFGNTLLSDQTNSSLTLAAVGSANAGSYDAVALSAGGSTTSSVAVLTIASTPIIVWSFTNLVLAADADCGADMPDITGTNYVAVSGGVGAVVLAQSPPTNAVLELGTNIVVMMVDDSAGDLVYSTNTIVVADETPPVIVIEPQGATNAIGDTVTIAVTASACSPLSYQWFLNNNVLFGQTNAVLTLTGITFAQEGNYTVMVNSAGGYATSMAAQLIVNGPLSLAISSNPGGGFVLTATGPASGSCIFEMNTNVTDPWLTLFTNGFGNNSAQFIDTSATNDVQRFYRALLGP